MAQVISTDLKALEALLGRRLKREEVEQLREAADQIMARARLSQRFEKSLAEFRATNPAAVSAMWGFA